MPDIVEQSTPPALDIVEQDTLNQAISQALAPPFWSALSATALQAYTWLPPWQPPGSSYIAPSLQVKGTSGKDFVSGSDAAETLQGLAGPDLLFALGGDDYLTAGEDDDVLFGGDGNDVLLGDAGNDLLEGENGSDWLNGGTGVDTLTGGAGQDVFAFILDPLQSAAPVGTGPKPQSSLGLDTVTDFTIGEDLLLVGGLLKEQPAAGSDPFAQYIQLTQLQQGTLVSVKQTDALGQIYQTDIAVLTNVVATDLSASSFALA